MRHLAASAAVSTEIAAEAVASSLLCPCWPQRLVAPGSSLASRCSCQCTRTAPALQGGQGRVCSAACFLNATSAVYTRPQALRGSYRLRLDQDKSSTAQLLTGTFYQPRTNTPDELVERLAAGLTLQQQQQQQQQWLSSEQLTMFKACSNVLRSWVKRQRVDKVWGAADALLKVLGV
ncbi:hypothetical protein OEZ85_014108 [Tetradesmus obliquus]|uniref:Uncharacterized protein n=1 Tax=Tetradesmus obliquus TaxID=3088 RepID=A0ABY8U769_TETOB|nr:hypothetical protein OEZ85_014108 [Tetradesmus obliquus]